MKRLLALSVGFLLMACQSVDIPDDEGDDAVPVTKPIGVGEGTSLRPWTVAQVQRGDVADDAEGWVIGYAVGATSQSMSNAVFSSSAATSSNVLLSADSLCAASSACIPVELKSDKIRRQCAIPYHTQRFRQCLMVHGRINTYFRVRGVRAADQAVWWEQLDLTYLDPQPQPWD